MRRSNALRHIPPRTPLHAGAYRRRLSQLIVPSLPTRLRCATFQAAWTDAITFIAGIADDTLKTLHDTTPIEKLRKARHNVDTVYIKRASRSAAQRSDGSARGRRCAEFATIRQIGEQQFKACCVDRIGRLQCQPSLAQGGIRLANNGKFRRRWRAA